MLKILCYSVVCLLLFFSSLAHGQSETGDYRGGGGNENEDSAVPSSPRLNRLGLMEQLSRHVDAESNARVHPLSPAAETGVAGGLPGQGVLLTPQLAVDRSSSGEVGIHDAGHVAMGSAQCDVGRSSRWRLSGVIVGHEQGDASAVR